MNECNGTIYHTYIGWEQIEFKRNTKLICHMGIHKLPILYLYTPLVSLLQNQFKFPGDICS